MDDAEFLLWLRDRLVHVYGESPQTDLVLRLEKLEKATDRLDRAVLDLSKRLHNEDGA